MRQNPSKCKLKWQKVKTGYSNYKDKSKTNKRAQNNFNYSYCLMTDVEKL